MAQAFGFLKVHSLRIEIVMGLGDFSIAQVVVGGEYLSRVVHGVSVRRLCQRLWDSLESGNESFLCRMSTSTLV